MLFIPFIISYSSYNRDEKIESRILVKAGDISKPNFGLKKEEYYDIINNISDIYHSGAWVNMTIPYVLFFYSLFIFFIIGFLIIYY